MYALFQTLRPSLPSNKEATYSRPQESETFKVRIFENALQFCKWMHFYLTIKSVLRLLLTITKYFRIRKNLDLVIYMYLRLKRWVFKFYLIYYSVEEVLAKERPWIVNFALCLNHATSKPSRAWHCVKIRLLFPNTEMEISKKKNTVHRLGYILSIDF